MHRNQFQSDYRNSTWQEGLRPLAPYVLVALVLILGVGYYTMMSPDKEAPLANPNAAAIPKVAAAPKVVGGKRLYRR